MSVSLSCRVATDLWRSDGAAFLTSRGCALHHRTLSIFFQFAERLKETSRRAGIQASTRAANSDPIQCVERRPVAPLRIGSSYDSRTCYRVELNCFQIIS